MSGDRHTAVRLLSDSRLDGQRETSGAGPAIQQSKSNNSSRQKNNDEDELEDLIHSDIRKDNVDKNKNRFGDGTKTSTAARLPEEAARSKRCAGLRRFCQRFTAPLLAENHPLPANPTKFDHLKRAFFCPPFGRVGAFFLVVVMFFLWWGVLISITKEKALPGGIVFPMFVFFVGCWCGGYLIALVNLPPLFGMLLMGIVLGNVPGIDVGRHIDSAWSSTARNIALTVILLKAGLGLDPVALRKLSFVVLRLAFCPSLVEAAVDSVAAHLILGFSWPWAILLAFVMAVVSPAVIVPSMLGLSDRGYGLDKGIPTLVIAAVSMDAVLAITGFGVMLGIVFSSSNIVLSILKGPLEVVVGIVGGCAAGVLLWYIPQKSSPHQLLFRSTLLFGAGLVSIFGSKYIGWSGCGPLACLGVAFVAALRWRQEYPKGQKTPVEDAIGVLWLVFQPLLFGLIGAKVDFSKLEPHTVGLGAAVLFSGLIFRLGVAYLTVLRSSLNTRERAFIPFSWVPKATVQAAIGGIALDTAIELDAGPEAIELGSKVLTIAVLAILITAPIGALLIALLGPRLLHKTEPGHTVEDGEEKEEEKAEDFGESPA
ncbi:sodium/hydrogen exchanger 9B2-like isoform X2 [Babylonia areolata]|uniref:sodium/hydrogen exchanger 9B2-like isoform X2 n=1 Tax=Babylonia areolata TaxID=304850 RepID=UPI003FD02A89